MPREQGPRGRRSRRSVCSARVFSNGGGTVKRRRPVHMLALVLGVVAAVPSIAAADTSFPAAAGDMTARGDLLVWTPWTGPGRLMSGFGVAASPLPIPRARFASVDLGADVRGRAVLVYSSVPDPPVRATAPSASTTSRADAISPRRARPERLPRGRRADLARRDRLRPRLRRARPRRPLPQAPGKPVRCLGVPRGVPLLCRLGRSTSTGRHPGVHPHPAARRPGGGHLVR